MTVHDDALRHVRDACLALPEVNERLSHGCPTFFIRDEKTFVMFVNNHHGDGEIALWLKAAPGVQGLLVEAAPDKFFVPPYQGPFGWIGVRLDKTEDAEIASHVRQAYRLVASKKLLATLPD